MVRHFLNPRVQDATIYREQLRAPVEKERNPYLCLKK